MADIHLPAKALLEAAKHNDYDKCVNILTSSSKKVETVWDSEKRTALHWAVINRNPQLIRLLLEHNFNKTIENKYYYTAAVLACELQYWDCVKPFFSSPIVDGDDYDTALTLAVKYHHYPSVLGFLNVHKLTLRDGKPVETNVYTSPGRITPLHWAVIHDDAEMVALLLAHEADQTQRNSARLRPFDLAVELEFWSCVVELANDGKLEKEDYSKALLKAVRLNQYQAAKALLEVGADANYLEDGSKMTALHLAVRNDNAEMIALLVEHNADVTACNESDWTPLHCAIHQRKASLVGWFMALGVSPEMVSSGQESSEPVMALAVSLSGGKEMVDCMMALKSKRFRPHALVVSVAKGNIEELRNGITQAQEETPDILTQRLSPNRETLLAYAVRLRQTESVAHLLTVMSEAESVVEEAFQLACELGHWQCAELINKERAMAFKLDKEFKGRLSIFNYDNTSVKSEFMTKAIVMAENIKCDKDKFFHCLANETTTALYRQFKFWSSDDTNTTTFFKRQIENVSGVDVAQQVVDEPELSPRAD